MDQASGPHEVSTCLAAGDANRRCVAEEQAQHKQPDASLVRDRDLTAEEGLNRAPTLPAWPSGPHRYT
jgi:hypothetical protein